MVISLIEKKQMSDRIFIDTNLFIYAFDKLDLKKNKKVINFFKSIREDDTHISIQIIKEFSNVNIKKFKVSEEILFKRLTIFRSFIISDTTVEVMEKAISLCYLYKLQYYDSLIIAAALAQNCNILYSEDLNNGQSIEGLQIINPFQ